MSLSEIHIRNFAIIDQTQVEFDDGLTVVTGETGAGKSIIMDALSLLLGSRTDASVIRHGEEQCDITAVFDISQSPQTKVALAEMSIDEDDTCIIKRIIRRNKPAKCLINDVTVTVNSLKKIGLNLVDLHGQHEHQSLLQKPTQRDILDNIAGHHSQLETIKTLYHAIKNKQAELDAHRQNASDHSARIELLEFQLQELNEADIQEDEFTALEQEFQRLNNGKQLIEGIEKSLNTLYLEDNFNISDQLSSVTMQLDEFSGYDPQLSDAKDLLYSAQVQIEEARSTLDSALNRLDLDPQRAQEVEHRLNTIIELARKHRCNENALPQLRHGLSEELAQIQNQHSQPDQLQEEIDTDFKRYFEIANEISLRRQKIAKQLSDNISEQMQGLGMQGGSLHIQVDNVGELKEQISETGLDQIEFLVSTNKGSPLSPLNKTASGGELSRISLAIQVIVSALSNSPTLIFDEVDVGVGGRIAEIVGTRLKQLGKNAQVICITHLPQVAAQGDSHLLVTKSNDNENTHSVIEKLGQAQRTEEIARMLGGATITSRTKAHAKEMLQQAS